MSFTWHEHTLQEYDAPYNVTATNERAVELSIAKVWLSEREAGGLEVGNVTSHYWDGNHAVVDLNEIAPGVTNIDVFAIEDRYDWVLSISTIEHVRWDDEKDPLGSLEAIQHLRSICDGPMLITIPLGYNQPLDEFILSDAIWTSYSVTYVRGKNGWEIGAKKAWRPYGPHAANAVWIGEWY